MQVFFNTLQCKVFYVNKTTAREFVVVPQLCT